MGSFVSGGSGTYDLTVTNTGAATSGTVTRSTPCRPANRSGRGGWSACSAAGQAVTCKSTTPIVSGTPVVIDLSVHVTAAAGTVLLTRRRSAPTGAAPTSTRSPFHRPPPPRRRPSMAHAGSFVSGGSGTYDLTVTNTGAATSGTVTVSSTLPTGESFGSGSGGGFACSAAGQAVTCKSTTPIVSGTPVVIDLSVHITAAAGTVLSDQVSVSPNGGSSNVDQVTVSSGGVAKRLHITTPQRLPNGTVGTKYKVTLWATGGTRRTYGRSSLLTKFAQWTEARPIHGVILVDPPAGRTVDVRESRSSAQRRPPTRWHRQQDLLLEGLLRQLLVRHNCTRTTLCVPTEWLARHFFDICTGNNVGNRDR